MSQQEVSKYVNNALASKKKHLYSRLLDYFLTFVVSYLLFTIVLPISTNLPFVKGMYQEIQDASVLINDYIDSTHLQRYDSDKKLLSVNKGAAIYVENVAKTSAYVHDIKFPKKQDGGTFVEVSVSKEETFIHDLTNYPLDNISYYFYNFKPSEASLNDYNGKKYEELTPQEIESFIYTSTMKVNEGYFVNKEDNDYVSRGEGVSTHVVLTKENTIQLLKYFREDRNDITIYNNIYNSYASGVQYGIKEVENKSNSYKELYSAFQKSYFKLAGLYIVDYLIAFFIAYLLLIFIPRLIFREYVTVGQRVLGLSIASKNDLEPAWWQLLIYYVLNFFAFLTTMFFAFLLTRSFTLLSFEIIPHINLLWVLIFLATLNLVSLFMPLFSKKNDDLTTLLSSLTLKDKNIFDSPVEAIEDKGTSDGK